MDTSQALTLLGGLSPDQFMKRHWHKKPLLIRQAIPGLSPLLDRAALMALAAQDDVESRLVMRKPQGWTLKQGPFQKKTLPPFKQPGWTVLVQGVDLHNQAVHQLAQQFRFVPDARMDDVMISYASDGGGVGPHFDSYDVFLLQAHGQRRWRIGRQKDLTLQGGVPLKILAHFEHEEEFILNPGDMLYLPPLYAHDGDAVGECMTYSIGFRAPRTGELARELLAGLAEEALQAAGDKVYRDPTQSAVTQAGAVPLPLQAFARAAVQKALQDPQLLDCLLGEYLTEPKAQVWFESQAERELTWPQAVVLDRRTRMMHDTHHVFINGESFKASGRDAQLLRRLSNDRQLSERAVGQLSDEALEQLSDWCDDGWIHPETVAPGSGA
jgi:50S ribosomal protein L16 3-hydroxylase